MRMNFIREMDKAILDDLPIEDFSNEYDSKIEKILSSSFRSIQLSLDDYFILEGSALGKTQKNENIKTRPLNDIVYEDIFDTLIKEKEYIDSFSHLLKNNVKAIDKTKSVEHIFRYEEEE